jgi:hypothetical protein
VLQRRAFRLRRNQAEVDGQSLAPDGDLGVPFGAHPVGGVGQPQQRRLQLVGGHPCLGDGQDVDVFQNAFAPPQAARPVQAPEEPPGLQPGDRLRGDGFRFRVQEQAPEAFLEIDGLEDLLLRLDPEALQGQQAVLAAGILQLAQAGDAQLLPELAHPLGPQPGQLQDLLQARREGGLQGLQRRGFPRAHQLPDHLGDGGADAMDPGQSILGGQGLQAFRVAFHDTGRALEGQGLVGILPLQLAVHRDAGEDRGDLLVGHCGE